MRVHIAFPKESSVWCLPRAVPLAIPWRTNCGTMMWEAGRTVYQNLGETPVSEVDSEWIPQRSGGGVNGVWRLSAHGQ